MKDKEMIEEMAGCQECTPYLSQGDIKNCQYLKANSGCDRYKIAKELYEQGYRKLPKDARVFIPTDDKYVLLSKEEYEKSFDIKVYNKIREENRLLKEMAEQLRQEIITLSQELQNSRKETAEKILRELIKNCEYTFGINGKPIIALDGDFALNTAKQFGVEIKE